MRATTGMLLAAMWAMSCGIGNGQRTTQEREAGDFDAILATQAVMVSVRYGEPVSITVEADENLLPMVETSIEGGRLHAGIRNDRWVVGAHGVRVRVVTPKLARVEATSSALVQVEGGTQPDFYAKADSSSRVEVRGLQVERLTGIAESGAQLVLEGNAGTFDARSTASANLAAGELRAGRVHLEATSLSTGVVNAIDELSGTVDSGAYFTVRGNPPRNSIRVESGAQVSYGE